MWSSFKVTKSSLNGADMCEAQVSKYSLICFNVAIGVDIVTMDFHVSELGVISEAQNMHVDIFYNPIIFPKTSLMVHEGAHSGSPWHRGSSWCCLNFIGFGVLIVPLIKLQTPVFHIVTGP